jgi:hypothetical protein
MPQQVVPALQGPATAMYGSGWMSPTYKSKALCRQSSTGNVVDPFYQFDEQKKPLAFRPFAIYSSLFATKFGAKSAKPPGFGTVYESMVAESSKHWNEGTIDYIEIHNEPDASWNNPEEPIMIDNTFGPSAVNLDYLNKPLTHYYFLPEQYAAMLSAAYDGDSKAPEFRINNLEAYWGIKNLSPYTKVVVGGSVDLRSTYWDQVVEKCQALPRRQNAPLPFDVMNYHFYAQSAQPPMSNTLEFSYFEQGIKIPGTDAQASTRGVHPEHPNITLRERVKNLISSQHNTLVPRNIPWWLTEMGYDTRSNISFVRIDPFGGLHQETIHGQWLTRYFLEVAAAVVGNKSMDKVYIYELDDNNSASGGYYETSGLVTDQNIPKRSWFHIQTLKNTLGLYRFDPFLPITENERPQFIDQSGVKPLDDPRIYRFKYGFPSNDAIPVDKDIYVLWVPRAENASYHGRLVIKDYGATKPTVRLTTVDETDEDGRKTIISPDRVSIVNGDLIIEGLDISETPIYLEFNASKAANDPDQLQLISDLTATCLDCEGNVVLNWSLPIDLNDPNYQDISAFYNIYYADAALYDSDPSTPGNQNNPSVFNPNSVQLLAYNVPGGATSAYVQNMLQQGHTYHFWVIPFVWTNGSSNGFQSGFGTFVNLVSGVHYTTINLATCASQDCATSISPGMVSNVNPGGFSGGIAAMLNGGIDTYCASIAQGNMPKLLDFNYGPTELSWEVSLMGTKYINAIHLYQATGAGSLKVEIKEDCCTGWKFVGLYSLNKHQQWHVFANGLLNSKKVERIRFTLSRMPGSSVGLGRMFFCTSPAQDICPNDPIVNNPTGGGGGNGLTTFSEGSVTVKRINTHSAYVTFLPAREQSDKRKVVPIYNIRYSIAKGIDGKLLDPLSTQIDAKGYTNWQEVPIANLHPDTEYFVEVEPERTSLECGGGTSTTTPLSLSFKTLPLEVVGERNDEKIAPVIHEIKLSPLPANHQINVQFEPGIFDRYAVINTAGATVLEGAIGQAETEKQLQFELSPGWYVFQCFGNQTKGVKPFVVVK